MKKKITIYKILKITAGGFHCWCESNVGVIRKPNNVISDDVWNAFFGIEPGLEVSELKWYQKVWNWIKSLFNKTHN